MKRLYNCAIVLAALLPVPTGSAEEEKTEPPPLRLGIDLVDGSHIIGVPGVESIGLRTSYAKMAIPLSKIRAIEIDEDRERASFELQNGDRIKGVLDLAPLELKTLFGQIKVDTRHIAEISILTGTVPMKGLVLHYSFDNDAGQEVVDDSGNERHGVARGPRWTREGKAGGAYRFDGVDDYIVTAARVAPTVVDEMTILLWAKPADLSGTRNNTILTRNFGGGEQYGMRFVGSKMYLNTCDIDLQFYRDQFGSFSAERWHHIVLSFSKKTNQGSIYVDGRRVDRGPLMAYSREPIRGDMFIGRDNRGQAHSHFSGTIDEVMIYDRALSDSDVRAIYDAQK